MGSPCGRPRVPRRRSVPDLSTRIGSPEGADSRMSITAYRWWARPVDVEAVCGRPQSSWCPRYPCDSPLCEADGMPRGTPRDRYRSPADPVPAPAAGSMTRSAEFGELCGVVMRSPWKPVSTTQSTPPGAPPWCRQLVGVNSLRGSSSRRRRLGGVGPKESVRTNAESQTEW